jgi:hypothetical protein
MSVAPPATPTGRQPALSAATAIFSRTERRGETSRASAAIGRGRRRVGGGVVEVDAGTRHGGRVRVCSLNLVGLGGDGGRGRGRGRGEEERERAAGGG